MTVEIKKSCPLGHTCERVAPDGKSIDRCHWYTRLQGENPQSREKVDQWACAIAWLPVLSVEMSKTNTWQTQAIQLLTDEVTKGNQTLIAASQQALRMQGVGEKQIAPGGNGQDNAEISGK